MVGIIFRGRILALVRWNLQTPWCKCPGVPRGQSLGWPLISALLLPQPDESWVSCPRPQCSTETSQPYKKNNWIILSLIISLVLLH